MQKVENNLFRNFSVKITGAQHAAQSTQKCCLFGVGQVRSKTAFLTPKRATKKTKNTFVQCEDYFQCSVFSEHLADQKPLVCGQPSLKIYLSFTQSYVVQFVCWFALIYMHPCQRRGHITGSCSQSYLRGQSFSPETVFLPVIFP